MINARIFMADMDSRLRGRGRAALSWGILAGMALLAVGAAQARDDGQWANSDPTIRKWYEGLMQPDVPTSSCCGEADAYWADEIHVRDGKTYAVITDDVGTEIEVPQNKLKWDRGNPTGHSVVFLSRNHFVFCFVQGGGA